MSTLIHFQRNDNEDKRALSIFLLIVTLLTLAALASGCKSSHYVASTNVQDSTHVQNFRKAVKDSVKVAADSDVTVLDLNDNSTIDGNKGLPLLPVNTKRAVTHNGHLDNSLTYKNGKVFDTCRAEEYRILLNKYKDSTVYYRSHKEVTKIPYPVPAQLTKWQSFCEVLVWILLAILVLYLGIREGPWIIKMLKGGL